LFGIVLFFPQPTSPQILPYFSSPFSAYYNRGGWLDILIQINEWIALHFRHSREHHAPSLVQNESEIQFKLVILNY
jgi:hypothetical protein